MHLNLQRLIYRRALWLLLSVVLMGAAVQQADSAEHYVEQTLPELIYDSSEHFTDIDSANLDGLLERIGDSRVVLLGEATHGSAEFYDMRSRITRELIGKKGFNIIAVEADWPDATSINHFVQGADHEPFQRYVHRPIFKQKPFSGFPTWMWANHSVLSFVNWLKNYNHSAHPVEDAVSFYGLDIYNMYSSIEAVLDYLQEVNPKAAEVARRSYACLSPWVDNPSFYSRYMKSGRNRDCGNEVSTVLNALRKTRAFYNQTDSEIDRQRYFNAVQNARLVRNGERYYRTMYRENINPWNLRDQNMMDTLMAVLNYHGRSSKVIVWAHNSHVGDARATEMNAQGQFNLGQKVRETFADSAYLIGFGTDHGTVAAAPEWGEAMKVMQVPHSQKDSYERLFHDVKTDNFMLPLRKPVQDITRKKLLAERLQRAIGTIYNPENDSDNNYSYSSLPRQFDEYIWFDETHAVKPFTQ